MRSPGFGLLALAMRMDDLIGQAAQVLDHDQAEHDGDGPDFADGQRCGKHLESLLNGIRGKTLFQ